MSGITTVIRDFKGDRVILLIVALLGIFSLLAVYSATGSMAYKLQDGNTSYYLIQQIMFITAGMALTFVCYQLHYMQYSRFAPLFLLLTIPLLIYTLGYGEEINHAKRWITLPWINKTIQTSDFAKLALLIYLARSISQKQDVIKDWSGAFLPLIVPVIIVCGLIAWADLSTGILLFLTCVLMMFIGRVHLKYIALLVVVGIMAFSLLVILGTFFPDISRLDTWVARITEFTTNSDGGFQAQQSKMAIAEGGVFGVGPGNSIQRNYLPYPYADFIYAIICEEYGLIGGVTVLGLFLLLLFRCTSIVTKCPKTFGAVLAIGLCLNIVIQAFANIAVSVNLVPVTGLTLPLVSMGGTSILFTCIALGIILSVSKYVEEARIQSVELDVIEKKDANSY